jgi:hypothetical protein
LANKFKVELDKYQAISGSTINYRKSQIYGWNYTPREMTDITRILRIMGKTQWDSFKYLGVPIFKASTKSSCWAPLVDKFQAKISAWGSSWLNPIGKLVLLKSVLSSILIYQCSILLTPKGIISKIEALLCHFLWKGGKNNDKNLPLVSWGKIYGPLLDGGL